MSILGEQENNEFLPYSTEQFIYTLVVKEEIAPVNAQPQQPVVILDVVSNHYLDTGITRTVTSVEIKDNKILNIVETWVSKNNSYITCTSVALALCVAAVITSHMYPEEVGCYLIRYATPFGCVLEGDHPYRYPLGWPIYK